MFQLKKRRSMSRETHIDMWNEAHYRALFGSATPANANQRGHRFCENFSLRRTKLTPGHPLADNLFAKVRLNLTENTFCHYVVCLDFRDPSTDADGYGYMSFGWQTLDQIYPSIDLTVYNQHKIADTVMRMYVEGRMAGSPGIQCEWTANINSMIGKSSAEVWGDWFKDDWIENPDDPNFLPGRRAFKIKSIEFEGM